MRHRVYYRIPKDTHWIKLSEFVNHGAAMMEYEEVVRKGYEAKIE